MQATGLIKHIKERWYKSISDSSDANIIHPFELSNTVMVFAFLGGGMVAALAVFFGELYLRDRETAITKI